MSGPTLDPVVVVLLRAALALLLVAAAAHKLRDRAAFRAAVAAYGLLPVRAIALFARALPVAELGVALTLVVPRSAHAGALAAAALLVLYALAIAVNLARGRREIDCGCFGAGAGQAIGAGLVVRNVVLVAAALVSLAPVRPRPLVWLDLCTVPLALAVLAALYAAADRLLAQAPGLARLRAEIGARA